MCSHNVKSPQTTRSGSSTVLSLLAAIVLLNGLAAHAGGPRWVAGTSYFNPAAIGQPLHWSNGVLSYYTDQGPLGSMDNATANAMVASAASVWNGVSTAAVTLSLAGMLDEDVNGANVTPADYPLPAVLPADVKSTATQKPLAIIYDNDGAVIDALLGAGASNPDDCFNNIVITAVDNMSVDGTLAHALIVLNGRCTGTPAQASILSFQLSRAIGQVLGLDWSQANEQVFTGTSPDPTAALAGWPLMHPNTQRCNTSNGVCMPNQTALRFDDTAALSRLYPVTAANIGQFSGKVLTAQNTVAIHGTISFSSGQGMEGVNVVVRPLIQNTSNADWSYSVSAISGALFHGQNVNPVNGTLDSSGNALDEFGSGDAALEGAFDLSAIPLPPSQQQADYQITFEPINRLDSQSASVGPYVIGNPTPSGTMPTIILRGLSAGSSVEQDVVIQDSATAPANRNSGTVTAPAALPPTGEWVGRISGYGHSDWFSWPIVANRVFTVEAVALDGSGSPTQDKARVLLGIWDTFDAVDSLPVVSTIQALNAQMTGGTSLRVATQSAGQLRLGVADQRGDGRPDYVYQGRLLYAASVSPSRLQSGGGAITIRGSGFRSGNTVSVNGVAAQVTSIGRTEITAVAPPLTATGSVIVEVDDPLTLGITSISDGLSYDPGVHDILDLISGPSGVVLMDVPLAFNVQAIGGDGLPAAGVTITYSIVSGNAILGCGHATCAVISAGDGSATMSVTAISTSATTVMASLNNGSSVQTTFTGGYVPSIAGISNPLYLAQGATYSWTPQVIVLQGGVPIAGKPVRWTAAAGVTTPTSTTLSNAHGIAQANVTAGPLAANAAVAVNACILGTASCAQLMVTSVDPTQANLEPVSGVGQTLSVSGAPTAVVFKVVDNAGHPMAGGTVTFYESLDAWTPTCPVHGRCATAEVLAKQTATAISGADGLVTLTPMTRSGVPTRLWVTATTGNWAALKFEIEQHP